MPAIFWNSWRSDSLASFLFTTLSQDWHIFSLWSILGDISIFRRLSLFLLWVPSRTIGERAREAEYPFRPTHSTAATWWLQQVAQAIDRYWSIRDTSAPLTKADPLCVRGRYLRTARATRLAREDPRRSHAALSRSQPTEGIDQSKAQNQHLHTKIVRFRSLLLFLLRTKTDQASRCDRSSESRCSLCRNDNKLGAARVEEPLFGRNVLLQLPVLCCTFWKKRRRRKMC